MGSTHWAEEHREWHRLFDAACDRKGFFDNSELASLFCARAGRTRREDFEAAKAKLRGWRAGRRLPRRANFFILSELLQVDRDPDLHKRWSDLYRAAAGAGQMPAQGRAARPVMRRRAGRWLLAGTATLAGIGLAVAAVKANRKAAFIELPSVGYDAYVRVPVGTSRLIHGEFAECDGPPLDWETVAAKVPSTVLGTFADGGLARKMVNDCGKEMVVRAVMFTGLAAGTEEVRLLDDYMKIEVVDAAFEPRAGDGR